MTQVPLNIYTYRTDICLYTSIYRSILKYIGIHAHILYDRYKYHELAARGCTAGT